MKKITVYLGLCLCIMMASCGKKSLNLPTSNELSYGLNSTITLIKGANEFNTQDYIIDLLQHPAPFPLILQPNNT